jgi:hypothetical protein
MGGRAWPSVIGFSLQRWLAYQVFGKIIRKPPQRADTSRGPARDGRYRAWIRTLPCTVCGVDRNIEACHTGPRGLGQKASDYTCVPLCAEHHRTGKYGIDKIGHTQFEQRFTVDLAALVRRLNRIWFEARKLPA